MREPVATAVSIELDGFQIEQIEGVEDAPATGYARPVQNVAESRARDESQQQYAHITSTPCAS